MYQSGGSAWMRLIKLEGTMTTEAEELKVSPAM